MTSELSNTSASTAVQVGARLRLFACNRRKLTREPWVLQTVSEGYAIEFS